MTDARAIDEVLRRELDEQQCRAATDTSREVLCLACAGSGKSRTLAFRIARLLAGGEPPDSIVAFTFTDKAAETIKRRVATALEAAGLEPTTLGAMFIGTIHSYCQRVLAEMDPRYRQYDVLDENRLKLYLISRYPQLGLHQLRRQRAARYFETVREVSDAWKTLNDEMAGIDDVRTYDEHLGLVLENLRDRLDQDEFIDFSLMIRLVVEAFREHDPGALRVAARLRHLMVDEYQDINPSQEAFIGELNRHLSTLFVVGDDDQAIYAWRGADVSNIMEFPARHPGCAQHTLSRNYRSTPPIVETADRFVAAELGATRMGKNPYSREDHRPRDTRKLWFARRQDEAEWVAERIRALLGTAYQEKDGSVRGLTPGDFAILMKSTGSDEQDGFPRHLPFTQALEARGIPYTLEAGGGAFDRPQVAAIRDTFLLLRDGSPSREQARRFFDSCVTAAFPNADFAAFARVLAEWGRLIHTPVEAGARRRVYPQQLLHDVLNAFGIAGTNFGPDVMRPLGLFSRIIQDVEAVYLSIDSPRRFAEILNFLENVAESGYDLSTEEILRRPDLVTVSTVHKAKGLEFPVVFVVDVEAGRFPGRRGNYRGWLPPRVMQHAVQLGRYQNTPAGEARLFYTACTRAERFLYVTGSACLPGGRKQWKPSSFMQRMTHEELSTDAIGLPEGLVSHAPRPRIDETVVPTSYSEIRYYLRCPRDYQFRKSYGFSPPIGEMFGFGMTVHTAVGKLHQDFSERLPTGDEAEQIAVEVFHLKHISPSSDPVNRPAPYERAQARAGRILRDYAGSYSEDFNRRRQVEVSFEVPVDRAVISGTIDLMLTVDPDNHILEASVIDFKAIQAGQDPEESEELHWTELALQVQLYAKAAREVLGQNARTGAVHLLKDNIRVSVPVAEEAIDDAVGNVEWTVRRILDDDFPMRPHAKKCADCDFKALCPMRPENFRSDSPPPPIHIPGDRGAMMARAFSEFDTEINPERN